MNQIYGVYVPQKEGISYIQAAFADVGLTLNGRNEDRYRQLLQEQRHIPRPLYTYGYRSPHNGRHLFFITDKGLIIGGVECVPVFWYGTGRGESHIFLRDLVVLPRFRRQQVATILLQDVIMKMQAKDAGLPSLSKPFVKMRTIITAGHGNAIRLFHQCGWELVEGMMELYECDLAKHDR